MRTAALVFTIALALSAAAHADDAAQARDHYQKGSSYFDVGRFAEAAQEYELAYQLKNDPALLFNLGQAYRFAGDAAKAIVAYKSFLRHAPDAPNYAEVQQHIADLQQLLDQQKQATSSPSTGTLTPTLVAAPPPPPPQQPIYKKWWLWTAVGAVVVVGVAVGVGVGVGTRASGTNLPGVTF